MYPTPTLYRSVSVLSAHRLKKNASARFALTSSLRHLASETEDVIYHLSLKRQGTTVGCCA
jgi:hypothetical protein